MGGNMGDNIDEESFPVDFPKSDSEEPHGYDNAFFMERDKSQRAIIESLLETTEKQANIISEQYDAIKNMGDKIYEIVKQNSQVGKAIYEATIALPDHVKTMHEELETILRDDLLKDIDGKAFSRFEVLRDNLLKVHGNLNSIRENMNIQVNSYNYTEEIPNSFSPGGSRGVG